MQNIQIFFDDRLLQEIDRVVSATHMSRSEIIMNAVSRWLKEKESERLEREWIEKLRQVPDNQEDAEKWINVQSWSEE
ncbi:MAG: hypothetical protein R2941_07190 [Desulfobacterales bacterium]